jgi:hypothetical protein
MTLILRLFIPFLSFISNAFTMCWRNDAFSIGFEPVDGAVEVVIDIDVELYKSLPPKVQALFSEKPKGYRYRHTKAPPNK